MAARARPHDEALIEGLRAIVGDRGLVTGTDVRARSCDPFRPVPPLGPAIVRPACTEDVSRILSFCQARGQGVVTHGGRTGVAGGAYADADDIVLSLERMNRIEEVDPVGPCMTVEAGVTIEAVQNAAAERDLLYPVDFGAKGSATVGGSIATNAGGNRVVRWGMTRANVLGIEAVLADGTVVSAMNRLVKNNTGYDLKHLFIGSEGTTGIVTRAVLRLVAAPCSQHVAFVGLAGFAAVLDLLSRARRLPALSAFEVMWQDYYVLVAGHDATRMPIDTRFPFCVLVETMGYDAETDAVLFDRFLEGAYAAGVIGDAVMANSGQQAADLWRVREGSEIIVRAMSPFVSFDISVDIRRAEAFVAEARAALEERFARVRTVTFGHLGDNNLHLGIHIGPDTAAREIEIEHCVYGVVGEFGGALTAEHGVGRLKRAFLPGHVSPGALDVMRRVRSALDPDHALNRKVLF
ncbi:FAD-binding oxidoreductase [Sphingomonas profundi]|uniref:FAD-binding oxidoreductase n=1 Tax=Alterirhizorhabdus profundi TaxID=2681549 RepID=UPI0012E8D87A|nr:FAD-binding oxidoreductase [Sphingomonas profundi]